MNIFLLDGDPKIAARYHNDKHVVKMILETGQLLSGVHHHFGSNDRRLYAATHMNHPCAIWARTSASNYRWLYTFFNALTSEYIQRYNRIHHTALKLMYVTRYSPKGLEDIGLTPFALAMPDQYKQENAVEAYRAYYKGEKARFSTWRHPAKIPEWFLK